MTWGEEIDIEHRVCVMGVDKLSVFAVVLHTRADAAPHAFVYLRIDAVSLWAQRGEIDITTRLRVLCGEDMVERGILIEVGVAGIVGAVGEYFREFQHVVGVAALRSVGSVDIAVAVGFGEEVLFNAVAADACRAVICHIGPEVLCSLGIALVGKALFGDTFEADILWYLRVGVPVVEKRGVERLHAVDHCLV